MWFGVCEKGYLCFMGQVPDGLRECRFVYGYTIACFLISQYGTNTV